MGLVPYFLTDILLLALLTVFLHSQQDPVAFFFFKPCDVTHTAVTILALSPAWNSLSF